MRFAAEKPGHVVVHEGRTTLFDDGTGDIVVIGCQDGALIYAGGIISKVFSPDAYGRIGNQAGTEASPIVLGDYKTDAEAVLERPHPYLPHRHPDRRADDLKRRLGVLDSEFAAGLAPCAGATLVASHEAFGYLAQRYDLVQLGIAGINPDAEPPPARLREVRAVVERDGVRTLYFEVLVSSKVTTVLAEDLGVRAAVLDPIEGRVDTSGDYFTIMRANLSALVSGLACG